MNFKAYNVISLPTDMESVEMKIWVTNFVKTFQRSMIPNNEATSSFQKKSSVDGALVEGVCMDVQLMRHLSDGFLYSSQLHQLKTKAELRAQVS
jgi:hypothetical protein